MTEVCGDEFIIDGVTIVGGWPPKPIQKIEDETLICTLTSGHIPRNIHGNGAVIWLGEEV